MPTSAGAAAQGYTDHADWKLAGVCHLYFFRKKITNPASTSVSTQPIIEKFTKEKEQNQSLKQTKNDNYASTLP